METIFPIITKKKLFSSNNRNFIRNQVKKILNHFFLTFHIYIYNFHTLLLLKNLMNDATSHLTTSLL